MPRVTAIALGGLLAGLLDLLAAFALGWPRVAPSRVLQYIASGALGPAAFRGGTMTALAGLLFHFTIAMVAAALYVHMAHRWPSLRQHPWRWGTAYGLAVYAVMTFVVLPLSQAATQPPTLASMARMAVIHVVCVGLPIAFAARRTS